MIRFEELNKPTKVAVAVPAETLFTNGTEEMFDMMNNSDVNVNVFRMYAQYWAQTTIPMKVIITWWAEEIQITFGKEAYRDALKDLE